MADDPNEESWLYGSNSNPDQAADNAETKPENTETQSKPEAEQPLEPENNAEVIEDDPFAEADMPGVRDGANDDPFVNSTDGIGEEEDRKDADLVRESKKEADDEDADGENNSHYSDEDDDDINVVIGDIKSGSSYNIKQRPPLLGPGGTTVVPEKFKQAPGKFSIDEFECVGTISGVPAHEFSIDSLDEKPWRKPGADITDYFNYGFNEDTWRAYCERQKHLRMNESGVGLQGLSAGLPPPQRMMEPRGDRMMGAGGGDRGNGGGIGGPDRRDDMGPRGYQGGDGNSMSGGFIRRAGPPPGRKPNVGQIDVIGSNTNNMSRRDQEMMHGASIPTKENMIQVMTAERREYSRIQGAFPSNEPFFEPEPNYNYGYEPTQEQQWNNDQPAWTPTGIKELTSGPQMVPPPQVHVLRSGPPMGGGPSQMGIGGRNDRERDRDRGDRSERSDRDRERDRDRAERAARDHGDRSRDRVKSEDRRDRGGTDRSERSSRRDPPTRERSDRSRSRESRRRRSKSRDKDRKSRDRKKSHKKEKEIKEERLSD